MDNLKTSLLFRMLDLFLRILAWGSAPAGASSKVRRRSIKKRLRNHLTVALARVSSVEIHLPRSPLGKEHAPLATQSHKPLPEENLLALSPKLLAKALAKAPLVDLLQIFSDCDLAEREHILNALRAAPLSTQDTKKLPAGIPVPFELAGATTSEWTPLSSAGLGEEECPACHRHGGYREIPSDLAMIVKPHPPPPLDSGWDDDEKFTKLLRIKDPQTTECESGMGIDREAFMRWVDGDALPESFASDAWGPPPPLFEDLPKAPPSRELRSFVMGRDSLSSDEIELQELREQDITEDESLELYLEHDGPPPRTLRSQPPDIPLGDGVRVLKERPDDWSTFQPLYTELQTVRKRFTDLEAPPQTETPKDTGGWVAHYDRRLLTSVIKPSRTPLQSTGQSTRRHPASLPWDSPGRGSPPGLLRPGGPPPVPIARRSAGRASIRSRLPSGGARLDHRQVSGSS